MRPDSKSQTKPGLWSVKSSSFLVFFLSFSCLHNYNFMLAFKKANQSYTHTCQRGTSGVFGSDVQELHQPMGGASKIPLPPRLVTQTCSFSKRKGDTNHNRWRKIPTPLTIKYSRGILGCGNGLTCNTATTTGITNFGLSVSTRYVQRQQRMDCIYL